MQNMNSGSRFSALIRAIGEREVPMAFRVTTIVFAAGICLYVIFTVALAFIHPERLHEKYSIYADISAVISVTSFGISYAIRRLL